MDRRLESLSKYDVVTTFVVGLGFLVPLAATLVQSLVDFRQWELGGVFFEILFRSLGFTLVQAALSAFVAGATGIAVGTLAAFLPGRWSGYVARALESVGLLIFILPGIAVALLVIDLNGVFGWPPREGVWALVWAHAFLNAPLLAASVCGRVRQWLAGGGREQMEAGMLLGSPAFPLARRLLRSVWIAEAQAWLPLVFFWSASNFATLLILGGARGRTSPEVLLFYSLLNDTDSGRLFVLMGTSLVFAFFGWKFSVAGVGEWQQSTESSRASASGGFERWGVWPKILLVAMLLSFVLPPLWLFVAPAATLAASGFKGFQAWLEPLTKTLGLGLLSSTLVVAGSHLLLRSSSGVRKGVAALIGCSATLLGAAWIGVGVDLWPGASPWAQIVLAAFAIALVQLPLAALWIESRLASIPSFWFESAYLLGASHSEAKAALAHPLFRDLFRRLAGLSFLAAFGEVALTSLFVRDTETLAQSARRLAQRYDFSGSAWILLSMAGAAVLVSVTLALARAVGRGEDAPSL